MRSASAEASGARRHRPWLTRTPRCGLRTSPLCTVPCVLRRRAATARGWGASCAPGSGMALAPAPATLVLPDHIGQCTLVPTTCRTHPFTLAPWHHRSSSSRSRSTETLPPRGAMARAVLTTYVPEPRRLGTVGAVRATGTNLPARAPKAQGSLPRGATHCTYAAYAYQPRACRTYRVVPWPDRGTTTHHQATSTSTSSPRSTSCRSSKPRSRSAPAPLTGERDVTLGEKRGDTFCVCAVLAPLRPFNNSVHFRH